MPSEGCMTGLIPKKGEYLMHDSYLIRETLTDAVQGRHVYIRHPLTESTAERQISGAGIPDTAKLLTETYELYPGIELSYHYYLADKFHICHRHGISVLSIDHCRAGRIGWEMRGGLSLYFGNGDLSFHLTDKCSDSEITLPLGYYEGFSLSLDTELLKDNMPGLLKNPVEDVTAICRKFCGSREAVALTPGSRIEHICSEIYDLPEQIKLSCLKLKCQELLLFLSVEDPVSKRFDPHYSRQVEIIRQIHNQMTEHPEQRYTIDDLAKQYLINTSALKSIFRSVYGMPIASYMKQYRITQAAHMLRQTDLTIAEAARSVGYESQSKFTAAFKDVMKMLPTDYRRQRL